MNRPNPKARPGMPVYSCIYVLLQCITVSVLMYSGVHILLKRLPVMMLDVNFSHDVAARLDQVLCVQGT